jgi:NADH-quinone oxidoreductase subunit J
MEKYLFFGLSALAIFSALMVLISKNPVHCLLYLILCFSAIVGHFLVLNAQFLAMVQLIIYAGAIMVLFLFTLMLLNFNISTELRKPIAVRIIAVISGGLLLITLIAILKSFNSVIPGQYSDSQLGLARNLGSVLFNEYMFPFEAASLLFLSAMVGAVMMVNKEK